MHLFPRHSATSARCWSGWWKRRHRTGGGHLRAHPGAGRRGAGAGRAVPRPERMESRPGPGVPGAGRAGPGPRGPRPRLGAAGARALVRFLDAPEAEVRYVALLTAGSLPHAELMPGVLRGPVRFRAGRLVGGAGGRQRTATALCFQSALPYLRQELVAKEPERRVLAARALGILHDRASVEGLIGQTASDDALSAQAAAEGLSEITRASFGTIPTPDCLVGREQEAPARPVAPRRAAQPRGLAPRLAAEELAGALGDTLDYSPDAPEQERLKAIARWNRRCSTPACERSTPRAVRTGRPGRSSHRPGPSPRPAAARAPMPPRQRAGRTRTARSR